MVERIGLRAHPVQHVIDESRSVAVRIDDVGSAAVGIVAEGRHAIERVLGGHQPIERIVAVGRRLAQLVRLCQNVAVGIVSGRGRAAVGLLHGRDAEVVVINNRRRVSERVHRCGDRLRRSLIGNRGRVPKSILACKLSV